MSKNKRIYEKINEAVRLLCDVYDILNSNDTESNETQNNNLLKISSFVEKYPGFTMAQIRHYIHQNIRDFNEKVTIKIGKRIFIKEQDFFEWATDKNQ